MAWYWYLLVLVTAGAVTAACVPLVTRLARRFDVIDYPDGRRVNTQPTPRLGGIALFAGIMVGLGLLVAITNLMGDPSSEAAAGLSDSINYLGVLAAITLMFAVGLVDDFIDIPARYKFLGQIVAACIAAASGVLFQHFTNPLTGSIVQLGLFAYPITVFYLVAFCNIINLIVGLDGLAAGIVAISALALFILAAGKGGYDAAFAAMAIIGACVGFLFFNSYPARIFMGDSGALTLGFTLGVVSLFGVVRAPALMTLFVPVVIAGIPVVDTLGAIIRRLRANRPISEPDTEHIHHRFINIGFDQRTTVLIMYALSALLAVCAILVAQYGGAMTIIVGVVLLALMVFLIWRLGLTDSVLTHYYVKRELHHDPHHETHHDPHHEHSGQPAADADPPGDNPGSSGSPQPPHATGFSPDAPPAAGQPAAASVASATPPTDPPAADRDHTQT